MRTLDVDECAAYLKVDRTTVMKLAMHGVLPGAKIGRAWVFPEDELSLFLSNEVKRQQAERRELQVASHDADTPVSNSRSKPDAPVRRGRGQRLPSYLQTLPEPSGKI